MLAIMLAVFLAASPCHATSPDVGRVFAFVDPPAPLDVYASAPTQVRVADAETVITATLTLTRPLTVDRTQVVAALNADPVILYTCEAGVRPYLVYVPML